MPDVDRLASGRWQARWRDESGQQRKRSFRVKAEATAWLVEVESSKARGAYVDHRAGRITLVEYARQWAASRPHRPATALRVESMIRTHLESQPIGSMALGAIRPSHVQGWATGRAQVLSPSTTRLVVKVLRSIMLAAVEDRLIGSSPARRIALPAYEAPRVVALTVEEVRRLADAAPARGRAMVVAQGGLGLRLGELLALRRQDVDFLRRVVRVEAQIRKFDRERVEPKTARSKRVVPLPQVVADALAEHMRQWPPAKDGTLFTTGSGEPWRQDFYGARVFRPAVAASGVPEGTTTHDLRHHYVSLQLDAGASVAEVADLIGDTVATVVATYAHMVPGREARARDRVDAAWCAPDVPAEGETGA